jgi:signal transduction histidine kinase
MLKELPEELEISISDNGGGIPEDVQEKVFMPNFTTKSTGAGLGLAISKNIVEAGGGTITFSTTRKGTTFYVRIRK